ncbi:hypothetical protein ACIA8F_19750 [Streptomyces sp. NPDC051563]|uniref:hypothetical protein n=1 Tax=Streptomyces sp. NPDC051563 TaxID=3365659 RepID=UPI003793D11F
MCGFAALVLGCVLLALVPAAVAERNAFEQEPECPAPAVQTSAHCIGTVRFTVAAVRSEYQGRSVSHSVRLTGGDRGNGWVEFDSDGPVFTLLHEGDQVTGRVWSGHVMSVTYQGATQRTDNDPTDAPLFLAGLGAVSVSMVGWALTSGWCQVRHPLRCDGRHRPSPLVAKRTSAGLAAGTFALMFVLILLGGPVWLTWLLLLAWAPAAALTLAGHLITRTRKAG